ncbi:amino acid permease [Actinomycetospora termitidis]|uniref:Amino acid permease n=1 Tax=Actinomycetospora termitidis TaxID=3053470 RepID=A0ABT7M5V1_9PSEU|nr:amino acid permease [Actinomycetospora sp. Odt1-22]MDL5156055.1 amino acid permease [Actinomycetospora sp. Odt1-22]
MPVQTEHDPRLKKTLKTRHLRMLALGGVIGAGLFVGSSAIITEAGPGAFITYGITGVLVFFVMRMLGEMASAKPSTGSFTDYAGLALGRWAGFTTGWLYWYFWVIVVGFEAVVGGQIINGWIPALPVWVIALGLLVVMTAVNLLSVKSFGEAEYWFAGIKVAAILVFLIVGTLYVLHLWPGSTATFSNLTAAGGFLPNGAGTLFTGVVVVIFAMTGVEVVTIAAAESEEPGKNIRRAVNSVVFRILFFFVSSTLLIVIIRPWNTLTKGKSPFVSALETIGIPGASVALQAVILVAVLSVLNSGLYTSSRLLFVLGQRGDAPKWMHRVNRNGVPAAGVLACTVIGYACVVISAVSPDTVFLFLINSSGAVFLFVYLMICLSQIVLRRRWERDEPGIFQIKMWGYPWLPALVTLAIIAVLASMAFSDDSDTRTSLYQSIIAWVVFLAIFLVREALCRNSTRSTDPGTTDASLVAHEQGEIDATAGGPTVPATTATGATNSSATSA